MDDLKNLEYLSLVSKVCTELDNHLGINDKDLAEFIIHLARKSDTYQDFRKKLEDDQADFPDSFSSNLYRIIQKMLPVPNNDSLNANGENKSEQPKHVTDMSLRKALCPALCRPDDPNVRVSVLKKFPKLNLTVLFFTV